MRTPTQNRASYDPIWHVPNDETTRVAACRSFKRKKIFSAACTRNTVPTNERNSQRTLSLTFRRETLHSRYGNFLSLLGCTREGEKASEYAIARLSNIPRPRVESEPKIRAKRTRVRASTLVCTVIKRRSDRKKRQGPKRPPLINNIGKRSPPVLLLVLDRVVSVVFKGKWWVKITGETGSGAVRAGSIKNGSRNTYYVRAISRCDQECLHSREFEYYSPITGRGDCTGRKLFDR